MHIAKEMPRGISFLQVKSLEALGVRVPLYTMKLFYAILYKQLSTILCRMIEGAVDDTAVYIDK